jgi:chitinase
MKSLRSRGKGLLLVLLCLACFALPATLAQAAGQLNTPVFSPDPGAYTAEVDVSIMYNPPVGDPAVTIYYTTDGSDPDPATSPVYMAPVVITVTTTLKAIAAKPGKDNSEIASGEYIIEPPSPVATPVFDPAGGAFSETEVDVTISCATDGAVIYYTTDGTDPDSATGILYIGPVTIPIPTTLKAIAYKDDVASAIASAEYVPAPFTSDGGSSAPVAPLAAGLAGLLGWMKRRNRKG